jgi:peptidoglycan-associated lipoprotein
VHQSFVVVAIAVIRLRLQTDGLSKGGVMFTRSTRVAIVCVLSLAAALAGCAKRPATTQAAAPAPTGTGAATSAPPPTTSGTTIPSLPSPKEFVESAALRDVYFDFDRYDVRAGDKGTLDENAKWLKSNQSALLLIEGHADERGTNEYNLALGERRAKATRDYLVSVGVDAGRITVISYGEERPTCTEKAEGCWAKNRRAHFLVKQ